MFFEIIEMIIFLKKIIVNILIAEFVIINNFIYYLLYQTITEGKLIGRYLRF